MIKERKKRIWELDFLRGIAIILMMIDHFAFDVVFVFGTPWIAANPNNTALDNMVSSLSGAALSPEHEIARLFFVFVFFFISGISSSFSKNNWLRFLKISICAGLVTLVSSLFELPIYFGVLHFLAISVLIFAIIQTVIKNDPTKITVISIFLLLLSLVVNQILLANYKDSSSTPFLGIISSTFESSIVSYDYFPILDYLPFVFSGVAISPIYRKKQTLVKKLDLKIWKPFTFVGKYSLWFYMLHQAVFMVVLCMISYFALTPKDWILF